MLCITKRNLKMFEVNQKKPHNFKFFKNPTFSITKKKVKLFQK
jgi:hypothetical protein